jgi:transcriptional regulator with XRE-family HTH domain
VPTELDLQLAKFLRVMRGDDPRASFGRRIGVSEVHVSRLEAGASSATLNKLDGILKGLRCTMADIFGAPTLPAVSETPARYDARPRRKKPPRPPCP